VVGSDIVLVSNLSTGPGWVRIHLVQLLCRPEMKSKAGPIQSEKCFIRVEDCKEYAGITDFLKSFSDYFKCPVFGILNEIKPGSSWVYATSPRSGFVY
jgi:hypothetical protein